MEDEKCVQNFCLKNLTRRDNSASRDNIRTDRKETGWEGVDFMHLVQDRDQWRALVNTVMNFPVP